MAEEKVPVAAEAAGVDDAELSQAWEQEVGSKEAKPVEKKEDPEPDKEVTETPPAQEASPETPEQVTPEQKHKERSDLGRKFKDFKEESDRRTQQLLAEIDQLKKRLPSAATSPDDTEIITTAEDVRRVQAQDKLREQVSMREYEANYLSAFNSMAANEADLQDEIWAKVTSNNFNNEFNRQPTGRPDIDAQINYANAKAAVLSERLKSKPELPERNISGKPPIQPAAAATHAPKKTVVLPKMDAQTESFVAYLRSKDVSEEEIAASLE